MAKAAKKTSGASGKAASASAKSNSTFSKDEDLKAYEDMLLIRRFEEKAGQLYGMGHIGGFCHLYIGQEAVVVGMEMAMVDGDQMITSYRDHGHMLACGMDPKGVMAELTGRQGGYSRGKGGSMHMFSREKEFYGGHGIVGAQVPLGAGLAFANKYSENGKVSVAYFGEGATNQGQVYETFNMASHMEAAGDIRHREQWLCHGHCRETLRGNGRATVQPRLCLRHSRRTGGRHGRAHGEGSGRQGHRTLPLRQGAVHS